MRYVEMDWMKLAQNWIQSQAFVDTVMSLRIPYKQGIP
jgi:hypothetical protein